MKGLHSLIVVVLVTLMFIVNFTDDVIHFILYLSFGIPDICSTEGVMPCTTQHDNFSQ